MIGNGALEGVENKAVFRVAKLARVLRNVKVDGIPRHLSSLIHAVKIGVLQPIDTTEGDHRESTTLILLGCGIWDPHQPKRCRSGWPLLLISRLNHRAGQSETRCADTARLRQRNRTHVSGDAF